MACSFWLVDAYIMLGRLTDARRRFETLLALSNDLGLLSEEYDSRTRRLVGNLPQAFSHLVLVNAAISLGREVDALARRPKDHLARARGEPSWVDRWPKGGVPRFSAAIRAIRADAPGLPGTDRPTT